MYYNINVNEKISAANSILILIDKIQQRVLEAEEEYILISDHIIRKRCITRLEVFKLFLLLEYKSKRFTRVTLSFKIAENRI